MGILRRIIHKPFDWLLLFFLPCILQVSVLFATQARHFSGKIRASVWDSSGISSTGVTMWVHNFFWKFQEHQQQQSQCTCSNSFFNCNRTVEIPNYSPIAFDERVTFWLRRVRSLPWVCAYGALSVSEAHIQKKTITQLHMHTMQHRHTHKAVTKRVKAKKLLSCQRQLDFAVF